MAQNMSKIAQHSIKMAWNMSKMAQKWHQFNEIDHFRDLENWSIIKYPLSKTKVGAKIWMN